MKISEILEKSSPSVSFEIFPPRQNAAFEPVVEVVKRLSLQKPSFMSVTYGAAGSANANTIEIAKVVQDCGVTALAHLTCISSSREKIGAELAALKSAGVENVLALRGDRPVGSGEIAGDYAHASDLVAEIRSAGGFSIGGACYPECHPECSHIEDPHGCLSVPESVYRPPLQSKGVLSVCRKNGRRLGGRYNLHISPMP